MSHAKHNHGGSSSGSGVPVPTNAEFQQIYWAAIGSAIAFGAAVNAYNILLCRQRISAATKGSDDAPAKPKSWMTRCNATLTAIMREASDATVHFPLLGRSIRTPTVGSTFLVTVYLMIVVVFSLYGYDVNTTSSYSDIAYRTGFVAACQLPLVFLLAGKNNIIGWLTGSSYERINYLHRWISRGFFLTTTLHLGYWIAQYWRYPAYLARLVKGEGSVGRKFQTGLICWVLFAWIVLSSAAPLRRFSYEVFVVQHLLSFTAFMVFVYMHLLQANQIWFWIAIGLFFFDRAIRLARTLYINLSIFHRKPTTDDNTARSLWACKAEFQPLCSDTTKITIRNPPISWKPGQHVFVSCHSLLPLQSHPFTIASIPSDRKMEFFVKSQKGATRRFYTHAESQQDLTLATTKGSSIQSKNMAIEGPYGCIRPLKQFDSVVFLAGSTGATFTTPLLRDLVASCQPERGAATRRIRYIWVIKTRSQLEWFSAHLSSVLEDAARIQATYPDFTISISIHCTCDETFTSDHPSKRTPQLPASSSQAKPPPPSTAHGIPKLDSIELTPVSTSTSTSITDEKKSPQTSAKEILPTTTTSCSPNGTCCCRALTSDPDAILPPCCCGTSSSSNPSSSTASLNASPTGTALKPALHPSISLLTGRPDCRSLIRTSLEQARGESAVVVCGPRGLVDSVRESVVTLSDERAVHKGTGAQGIYLHSESFGY